MFRIQSLSMLDLNHYTYNIENELKNKALVKMVKISNGLRILSLHCCIDSSEDTILWTVVHGYNVREKGSKPL